MKFDITPFTPDEAMLKYYNSCNSFEEFWNNCECGNWMLWMAAKLKIDDRILTKAKALCANTVRHLMADKRSTDALDAALEYAKGFINRDDLNKYVTDAYLAADATYLAADYTTAIAAYAAYLAATNTTHADYVAAVITANTTNVTAAVQKENNQRIVGICREVLTEEVFEKIK